MVCKIGPGKQGGGLAIEEGFTIVIHVDTTNVNEALEQVQIKYLDKYLENKADSILNFPLINLDQEV